MLLQHELGDLGQVSAECLYFLEAKRLSHGLDGVFLKVKC